jgi:hypothetical protein
MWRGTASEKALFRNSPQAKPPVFEPIASEPRMAHRLLKVQERYEQ